MLHCVIILIILDCFVLSLNIKFGEGEGGCGIRVKNSPPTFQIMNSNPSLA